MKTKTPCYCGEGKGPPPYQYSIYYPQECIPRESKISMHANSHHPRTRKPAHSCPTTQPHHNLDNRANIR
jgi:hypothetical protein